MAEQRWSDPHLWVALIAPIGVAITICATILFASFPIYYDLTNQDSVAGKITTTAIFVVLFLAGIYACVGFYQTFIIELREKFIARKIAYKDGAFTLRGYYFKRANFNETELLKVEPHVISERWFSHEMGTLMTRSTRFTIPSGQNVNWKVSLRDGRVFYIPGTMGQFGVWGKDDAVKLKTFLEARMQACGNLA
jgi:hypothetical protein